ncbi:Phage tail sheath protein FI [hydrothermal vent metagenome]|uniref:Phage tail sheath protein FI n=1 Tax=hydrothermal vent metagenome TaxID=652676 RepID=A0A3B0ZSX4_9ZZZZ
MGQMKTPGVYIVEKNAFPNSVVEVATAVPAFIGYTERADNRGKGLSNKPWRITSMSEFHNYFGFAPSANFGVEEKPADSFEEAAFNLAGKEYLLNQNAGKYLLYYSLLLFFQNGGGPCYIVSVGRYGDDIEAGKLSKGIGLLVKEQEPTMVVMPETVLLAEADSISVQQAALAHCGGKMRNRVAVLDVWGGEKDRQDPAGDCIDNFRSALGINYLDFSMAYYPWVNTTIVQENELGFENISNPDVLQGLLRTELGIGETADENSTPKQTQQIEMVNNITSTWDGKSPEEVIADKMLLNKSLRASSPVYGNLIKEMREQLNLLPPAAAMAGVFTMVDNTRGVWKAPANVSLSAVVSPAVNITHDEQEDLNVTTQGKSINAIRSFIGEGTLVWGARTLDGNSLDWRYINVRRTMIMLEESIRLASKAYVFEPNTANTWVTIKSMIRNFLTGIWKRGGLAGASPDDAFSVNVGLGETMTPEDILEGILRVTVLVAISRPAEFIEITFQQQMQKS